MLLSNNDHRPYCVYLTSRLIKVPGLAHIETTDLPEDMSVCYTACHREHRPCAVDEGVTERQSQGKIPAV